MNEREKKHTCPRDIRRLLGTFLVAPLVDEHWSHLKAEQINFCLCKVETLWAGTRQMTYWQTIGSRAEWEVMKACWNSSLSLADDFLLHWDSHWPLLMKTRSQLHSSGSFCVCWEVPSSTLCPIREYQTLSSLKPTLHVPRHLGISCVTVVWLPYLVGTIGWSSWRSSCRTTHTVQNVPLFCSSRSCKLAALGKCHMVGVSFVLFGFTWVYLELLLFLFFLFISYI